MQACNKVAGYSSLNYCTVIYSRPVQVLKFTVYHSYSFVIHSWGMRFNFIITHVCLNLGFCLIYGSQVIVWVKYTHNMYHTIHVAKALTTFINIFFFRLVIGASCILTYKNRFHITIIDQSALSTAGDPRLSPLTSIRSETFFPWLAFENTVRLLIFLRIFRVIVWVMNHQLFR